MQQGSSFVGVPSGQVLRQRCLPRLESNNEVVALWRRRAVRRARRIAPRAPCAGSAYTDIPIARPTALAYLESDRASAAW